MKRLIGLFAILTLGLFIASQSPARAGETSAQAATPQAATTEAVSRLALSILPAAPYSPIGSSPVSYVCGGDNGDRCRKNSDCCSGLCCTTNQMECDGYKGKCLGSSP